MSFGLFHNPSDWEVQALITISAQLKQIERKLNTMPTQADLDAALDTLVTAIDRVGVDFAALVAKIAATPAAADLSKEVAKVQAGVDAIGKFDPAAPAPVVVPPAPVPTPTTP